MICRIPTGEHQAPHLWKRSGPRIPIGLNPESWELAGQRPIGSRRVRVELTAECSDRCAYRRKRWRQYRSSEGCEDESSRGSYSTRMRLIEQHHQTSHVENAGYIRID